jgi:DNA polymerase III epsilon subunit-like protein
MRVVFFDLETGGTNPQQHPIIQIAAIAVDREFNELGSFEAKIDFDIHLCDPEALTVNSYDAEVWEKESRPAPHVAQDFSRFLKQYADVRMVSQRIGREYFVAQLAGHNAASFDGPFIQEFYRQCGLFLPGGYRVLDTLQRAMWHFHDHPEHSPRDFKLGTLCEHFGIQLDNAHDALADVRATVALCRHLTQGITQP